MKPDYLKELKKELDTQSAALQKEAAEQIEKERNSPEFVTTKERLETSWRDKGKPALAELRAMQKELGPKIDPSSIDWEALERGGVPRTRMDPARNTMRAAHGLLGRAIMQLAAIPERIARLDPKLELDTYIGCKGSDYIAADQRGVVTAPKEIRQLAQTLAYQMGVIETAQRTPKTSFTIKRAEPALAPLRVETDFEIFGRA